MSTPPALISPSKKSKQSYPMLPPKQYDGFCLKTIREDDKDDVLAFLNKFFFLDEPLNVSLKMLDGPNDRCLELEHFCLKSLYQHVSVMAVNDKSEIIGLMLGEVVHKDQPVS